MSLQYLIKAQITQREKEYAWIAEINGKKETSAVPVLSKTRVAEDLSLALRKKVETWRIEKQDESKRKPTKRRGAKPE